MQQRVMIAMALAADEPTTALDVTIQERILNLIADLNEKLGMSVLFITHDLGAMAQLCHSVRVMYLGNLVEESGTDELFENPLHPYEREKTCENRANIFTQFCKYIKYIVRMGGQAYIPLPSQRLRRDVSYRPYIFTNEELSRFLECTKNMPGSMQRKTVFYMLFSLLICTSLRLGEALRLKWLDIDWSSKPVMVSGLWAAR